MRRFLLYFFLGLLLIFLQSSLLPLFLPLSLRPNLMLILALYLGLNEQPLQAISAGMLLGAIQDSFSGHSLGLYVSAFLVVVLITRVLSARLNSESPLLLLGAIAIGTLLQNLLVAVFMTLLADGGSVLPLLIPAIPRQLLANLVFFSLLLLLLSRVQDRSRRSDRRLFFLRKGSDCGH